MKKLLLVFAIATLNAAIMDQKRAFNYDTWLHTFGEIINLIETKSYKNITIEDAMSRAFEAYVQLDPHSSFLTQKECKSLQEKMSEEMFGIGVVLPGEKNRDDEFFVIVEVQPDSPAEKATIKQGDKIIQIDKTPVKGLDIDEIMNLIKGEKGTPVELTLLRAPQQDPLTITVLRGLVKKEMAAAYYFPQHDIYYLLLTIFSEKSTKNVQHILTQAIEEKSKGIIIDLRNNTGGLFDSALEILNLFLPKGSAVASIKNRDKKVMGSWKASGKPLHGITTLPIIILVNNYTASASEILAGVLQEYRKQKNMFPVFIVGDETFGKGSIQEIIPLNNECALKLTTGLYYLAFDREIQGKGIEPDFLLEQKLPLSETAKWVTSTYGKESSLKDSIKPHTPLETSKSKRNDKDLPWRERKKLIISQDYYIQNAINLLNLYTLEAKHTRDFKHNPTKALRFLKDNYVIDALIECSDIALN